ncbi:DUF2840 domain-containing protein [Methylocystis sp. Sn-Cys]|uniref:DUF2840 domain-containing protein n=1 Tax=Methylocystis sp. Sn-Cys TaxID=1701263 RepID=UPI001FEF543C|nr:DUF2840 domain-containing protein [Methylocystis sp. Sn-Cys]
MAALWQADQRANAHRRRRVATFTPGAIFAFIRWASNAHGTLVSRVDILRA